jgi:hypothetical protein
MNVEFEIFILNLMKIMKVDMRTKMIDKIKNIRIYMFLCFNFRKMLISAPRTGIKILEFV